MTETLAKGQAKPAEHGITAVAYGVVGPGKDETQSRRVFEFCRALGIRVFNTESTDATDTLEKRVEQSDIKVDFHTSPLRENNPNHKVWDPNILERVKDRDPPAAWRSPRSRQPNKGKSVEIDPIPLNGGNGWMSRLTAGR